MKNSKLLLTVILTIVLACQASGVYAAQSDLSSLMSMKSKVKANQELVAAAEQKADTACSEALLAIESLEKSSAGIPAEKQAKLKGLTENLRAAKANINSLKTELPAITADIKKAKETGNMKAAENSLNRMLDWQGKWMDCLDELQQTIKEINN